MSREPRSLQACLGDLREIAEQRLSGTFFLEAADGSVAAITVRDGVIETVSYQGRRGDSAVAQLQQMASAVCSFRLETPRISNTAPPSRQAVEWLAGRAPAPAEPQGTASAAGDFGRYRAAVQAIAMDYLGPVAPVLCEAAFAECATIEQVIDELASKLPGDEAGVFSAAAFKACRGR